jgi:ClpP class serine protease
VSASAAYLIASAARDVVTTDRISGSIGVLSAAPTYNAWLTLIADADLAGAHKVDGNPYGPLPDDEGRPVSTLLSLSAPLRRVAAIA